MNKIIIDGDSLSFYCSRDSAQASIEELDSRMHSIFLETKAESYLIVLSVGQYFRHVLYKDYKASRNQYRERAKNYTKTLKSYLQDEWGAIHLQGVEADDVVAYVKTKYPEIIVCSPDKDVLRQIPGTHYDYRWVVTNQNTIDENLQEGRWVTTSSEEAERFLWTQVVMGDATDGVKGIPGIGPVKAQKLLSAPPYYDTVLNEYIKHFGTTMGVRQFELNYRLIYLLRNDEDYIAENISPLSIEIDQFINVSNMSNLAEPWIVS